MGNNVSAFTQLTAKNFAKISIADHYKMVTKVKKPMVVLDHSFFIIGLNKAVLHFFNAKHEKDLLGTDFSTLLPEIQPDTNAKSMKVLIDISEGILKSKTGTITTIIHVTGQNGSPIKCRFWIAPLLTSRGIRCTVVFSGTGSDGKLPPLVQNEAEILRPILLRKQRVEAARDGKQGKSPQAKAKLAKSVSMIFQDHAVEESNSVLHKSEEDLRTHLESIRTKIEETDDSKLIDLISEETENALRANTLMTKLFRKWSKEVKGQVDEYREISEKDVSTLQGNLLKSSKKLENHEKTIEVTQTERGTLLGAVENIERIADAFEGALKQFDKEKSKLYL